MQTAYCLFEQLYNFACMESSWNAASITKLTVAFVHEISHHSAWLHGSKGYWSSISVIFQATLPQHQCGGDYLIQESI